MDETVWARLVEAARRRPRAVLLRGPTGEARGVEVLERLAAFRHGLREAGVAAQTRVLLLADADPDAALAALAVMSLGALLIPIPAPAVARAVAIAERMRADRALVGSARRLDGAIPIERLAARPAFQDALAGPPPDAPALVACTSGTTGPPRGAVLTHGALAFSARAHAAQVRPAGGVWSFPSNPVVDAAQLRFMGTALAAGHAYALHAGPFDPSRLEAQDVTVARFPPVVYQQFFDWHAERPARWARDTVLGRLRVRISYGAPLSDAVTAFFAGLRRPVRNWYGTTETALIAVGDGRVPPGGGVGRLLPGVEVRIDACGEILVRSPGMMAGYLDQLESPFRDGFFPTGDLGSRGADGVLRVQGRRDDLLVLATGLKLPAREVEAVLVGDPRVAQAVVLGDGMRQAVALIQPAPGVAADRALFRRLLAERQAALPEPLRVERFHLVAEPLTADGKVRRRELAAKYAERLAHLEGPPGI